MYAGCLFTVETFSAQLIASAKAAIGNLTAAPSTVRQQVPVSTCTLTLLPVPYSAVYKDTFFLISAPTRSISRNPTCDKKKILNQEFLV